MPTKAKILSLKSERKLLLSNCKRLVKRSEKAQIFLKIGREYTKAAAKVIAEGTKTSSRNIFGETYFTESLDAPDLFILAQAGLIQEWHIFLHSVFGKVVLYYLKTNRPEQLPSQRFNLNKMIPSSLPNMRQSVSDAAKEAFSGLGYRDRINKLRGIFGIDIPQSDEPEKNHIEKLDSEMSKHVAIRNIFQHHRGIVKKRILLKIGRNYIKILGEDGNEKEFKQDEPLKLTSQEINRLNGVIKEYSKLFEVLP